MALLPDGGHGETHIPGLGDAPFCRPLRYYRTEAPMAIHEETCGGLLDDRRAGSWNDMAFVDAIDIGRKQVNSV